MVVCTFAGHREVFGLGQSQVVEILERLLEAEQEMTCYVGGKGEFDALCASAVRTLKHRHPDKAISLVLVLPYMEQRLNTDKEYYESSFDEILIPIELAGIHYKQAITARNRWMVDRADCLIAMVWRDHGGAYQTLNYAERCGKRISGSDTKNKRRTQGHTAPAPGALLCLDYSPVKWNCRASKSASCMASSLSAVWRASAAMSSSMSGRAARMLAAVLRRSLL